MRALALAVLTLCAPVWAAEPVPLAAGEAAPFAGVLIDEARAKELVLKAAEVDRLTAHLAAEGRLQAALEASWKAQLDACTANAAAAPEWYDDPELNRWVGFFIGVGVGVGALYGGAWLTGLAKEAAP